jgi:oligoribonuclease
MNNGFVKLVYGRNSYSYVGASNLKMDILGRVFLVDKMLFTSEWENSMNDVQTQTLVWIDLEMTGLNPLHDQILEIATIITDNNLQLIKEGPSFIIHADQSILDHMHPEVKALHQKSTLIDLVRQSTTTLAHAQEATMAFLKQYAQPKSPLCGNSVWNDRNFLAQHMPQVTEYLHYRLIDVTTIKELVLRWYAHDPDVEFPKQETHRALEDIRESIAELKHYRRYFFV